MDYNDCMQNETRCSNEVLTRRTIQGLIVAVVLLPVGMALLFIFGRFFAFFGDPLSSQILDGIALGLGVLWGVAIIALLIGVALRCLGDSGQDG